MPQQVEFHKQKHIKYWLRCLQTPLPSAYTPMDPNRMSLAFFTLSALELLGALSCSDVMGAAMTPAERTSYIDWIYSCQHPRGGFRAFPSTNLAGAAAPWCDPANVPATYFALASLLILRDDLARVRRQDCLRWLVRMQRANGSFGQTLGPRLMLRKPGDLPLLSGEDGNDCESIHGGVDSRFAYTALCIRRFLRRGLHQETVPDIDLQSLSSYISTLQTYDGGLADESYHEAHGGFTYCSVSALSIMNKLDVAIPNPPLLLHWLISRQTTLLVPDDHESDEDEEDESPAAVQEDTPSTTSPCIGLNGRPNKPADTCYCWWVCAALKSLGHAKVINAEATTKFLLAETQHFIGGFGKCSGDSPDLVHSYLGLATLALLDHPDLIPIDSAFCLSNDSMRYLDSLDESLYSMADL